MFFKKIIFCLIVGAFIFVAPIVSAQGLNDAASQFQAVGQKAGAATYENPQDLVGIGINAALTLVGLFFLVLMIYAGYLWMTAHGEEEPINKAKKIITSTIIGFVLVASAYSITIFVGKRFEQGVVADQSGGGGDSGGDPNLNVCCRVCVEKIGGNFYDTPDYAFISEAACFKSCSAEQEGECYYGVINMKDGLTCTANAQNFDCDENKPKGMD